MLHIKKLLSVLLVLLLMLPACALAQGEMRIVCTSFPCYDFARAVTGGAAEITLLIKPGAEVHSFEPTPADVLNIASCDLFVYVGGESDAWVEDILESFGSDAPQTLRFFDVVEGIEGEDHDHGHDAHAEYDEHIWTSPVNAMAMVDALSERLQQLNPAAADACAANAAAYNAEIAWIHARLTGIVENAGRRELIFADRFPFLYFAREYGLEWQAAFDSCSSESEPSAKTMMALIDRIIRDDVPVVYTIELSNQKTAKTLAAETGVEICTLHSVQNVTEADFSAGETYVSLMQRNADALEKGLN